MVLEYSRFYHVSYVPINSLLEGKCLVNVRACSETVTVKILAPQFTASNLKDPKKSLQDNHILCP
jgi:hypothetical protein